MQLEYVSAGLLRRDFIHPLLMHSKLEENATAFLLASHPNVSATIARHRRGKSFDVLVLQLTSSCM